jgi:hypothetical protein
MLGILLASIAVAILFKITQENVYAGFGITLIFVLSFMIRTFRDIDNDDIKMKKQKMLTPEGRKKYYQHIDSK